MTDHGTADFARLEHVNNQLRTGQMRYTYFLLAAVASAMAFAVNQTQGATASVWHTPLAAAVICWGMSFYFGCRGLLYTNWALAKNVGMLQVEGRMHPPTHALSDSQRQEIVDDLREEIAAKAALTEKRVGWQFWLLVIGAILFLGWHTAEMVRRATPDPPPPAETSVDGSISGSEGGKITNQGETP